MFYYLLDFILLSGILKKKVNIVNIYKHRDFEQWFADTELTNDSLKNAVQEVQNGLHDGNLGSGLYKKRIAMPGKGKRGSYRTLLVFKQNEKAFFVYAYAKNKKANISPKELAIYKDLSKILLNLNENKLQDMIKKKSLIEVK